MEGLFEVLVDGERKIFHRYEDIPEKFDNLIRFEPLIPPEPHTAEQHEWIEGLSDYLRDVMKRETK